MSNAQLGDLGGIVKDAVDSAKKVIKLKDVDADKILKSSDPAKVLREVHEGIRTISDPLSKKFVESRCSNKGDVYDKFTRNGSWRGYYGTPQWDSHSATIAVAQILPGTGAHALQDFIKQQTKGIKSAAQSSVRDILSDVDFLEHVSNAFRNGDFRLQSKVVNGYGIKFDILRVNCQMCLKNSQECINGEGYYRLAMGIKPMKS